MCTKDNRPMIVWKDERYVNLKYLEIYIIYRTRFIIYKNGPIIQGINTKSDIAFIL